ncbi:MAG: hypothetical protein ABSB33_06195 [Tepidisphaeraceae bacterium]|jgi:hypothetical protein
MSRIPVQRRERFEESNAAKRDLNYTIFSIIKPCIERSGMPCDHRFQAFVGGRPGALRMDPRLVATHQDETIAGTGTVE